MNNETAEAYNARILGAPIPPKLVPCPDCGKKVSLKALACPNCGRKLKPSIVSIAAAIWIAGLILAFLIYAFL
jgi:predicted amidophosphoribosyltransferase